MKPMFVKRDDRIFKSEYHPDVLANRAEGEKALYHVQGDKIYTTSHHPEGQGPHAVFEIRGDKIHTTLHHPEHVPGKHVFELGSAKPDASFIEKVIKNA
jgi:hypothetical protein